MKRVLVIDDDDQIRNLISIMLEREGYEVDQLNDGMNAYQQYAAHPYDVVITDIIMPEKEGLETIMEIRHAFPSCKVIAISGGGRISPTDCLAMAKHLGVEYTFPKPFERSALIEAVKQLTESAQSI
ncbi:MAG: response regulator [Kiritimatiellae bacterium]|nr:response regulator [Kiritimatiellia bacterium]MDD4736961.1 response regulator [Kiritimatiellia bacterium]